MSPKKSSPQIAVTVLEKELSRLVTLTVEVSHKDLALGDQLSREKILAPLSETLKKAALEAVSSYARPVAILDRLRAAQAAPQDAT